MGILAACMSVYNIHAVYLGARRVSGALETGVTCMSCYVVAGTPAEQPSLNCWSISLAPVINCVEKERYNWRLFLTYVRKGFFPVLSPAL